MTLSSVIMTGVVQMKNFPFIRVKHNQEMDKSDMSIGKVKIVCGIEIKKASIRTYITALERIKTFPEDFITACFPDMNLEELLTDLTKLDEKRLVAILTNVFLSLPEAVLRLIADLVGVDEAVLLDNEDIGLTGLAEIVYAFIEVNDLGKFAEILKETSTKIKIMAETKSTK